MTDQNKQLAPLANLKKMINLPSVQEQFENALGENKNAFTASLVDLFISNQTLQECDPNKVIAEALKAATLKLPINKSLGFAWIVPYKQSRKINGQWVSEKIPTFQVGYKGLIQLAMRSGIYRTMNADVVYEGEFQSRDKLSGNVDISGEKTSDEVIGYFAHFETINGFVKTVYGTVDDIKAHASKFSKSYQHDSKIWKDHFDAMAIKTLITQLFSKYALMSVEMAGQVQMIEDSEKHDRIYHDEANKGMVIEIEDPPETKSDVDVGPRDPAPEDPPPPEEETGRRSGPSF